MNCDIGDYPAKEQKRRDHLINCRIAGQNLRQYLIFCSNLNNYPRNQFRNHVSLNLSTTSRKMSNPVPFWTANGHIPDTNLRVFDISVPFFLLLGRWGEYGPRPKSVAYIRHFLSIHSGIHSAHWRGRFFLLFGFFSDHRFGCQHQPGD